MAQRGVMNDLFQPLDAVQEICIMREVPDVYGYLRGRGVYLVHTRPLNHIPQLV